MSEQNRPESVRSLVPNSERRAVVDVGTNSVKLLVADVGSTLKVVLKLSLQTGLGQGAFRTGHLQPEAIARTVDAVGEFAAEAADLGSVSIRVLATSATREAANGDELAQAIQSATGLSTDVISGEQEADYAFLGVLSDPMIGLCPILIVDVGGGSTQWVAGESGLIRFRKSTPLGTARLLDFFPPGDPPRRTSLAHLRTTVTEFMRAEVDPSLRPVLQAFCGQGLRLVGLGGALRTLTRLGSTPASPNSSKCGLLRREELTEQVERLWRLSLEERRQIPGLAPQKAEVILAGAVIHEAVLNLFGFEEILISGRGSREGFLIGSSKRTEAATAPPQASGVSSTMSPTCQMHLPLN